MLPSERQAWIDRYARGPALIDAALARVPKEVLQWRPAPDKWSVHQVVVHCGDSEVNSHMRIRYVVCEREPLVVGYDENRWVREQDYHAHPLEPALAAMHAARANTVPLLQRLTDEQWKRFGRHTEHAGPYSAERWLELYAEHLEIHARQIERTFAVWQAAHPARA
jgi:DinB superfamily